MVFLASLSLLRAGCHFKFWVADWFAQLNNKMGGDLKKIQVSILEDGGRRNRSHGIQKLEGGSWRNALLRLDREREMYFSTDLYVGAVNPKSSKLGVADMRPLCAWISDVSTCTGVY